MLPKPAASKPTEPKRKSILVVPSRSVPTRPEEIEDFEETEIAVEITLPQEGGWGWVVVLSSFSCIFILDGVFFTFGSIYSDMVEDLSVEGTLVALINSIALALYFISGPIVSALINRFGFRSCAMSGSIIVSVAYLCSYFTFHYVTLLLFYGVISGFGACLIGMPSSIVVGFYFERLRAIALSLAGAGSSVGVMVMFSVNSYLVNLAGWRITTLIHSGLFACTYFIAMAYRPLLSLTVTQTTDDPTRTVTYLPNLSTTGDRLRASQSGRNTGSGTVGPHAAERLFSAISNANFPTAASVVQEGIITQQGTSQAGASTTVSKLTLTARSPKGGMSQKQLNQVQSIIPRPNSSDKDGKSIEVKVEAPAEQQPKKRRWWARLCHWDAHIQESRPMYRDDAFYGGRLENLPVYQKSIMETPPEERTGLEYQLAVSRVVTTADLEERRGIYTTAFRRTLATMMDPTLLGSCTFLLLCACSFFSYVGLLVPYIFLPDRNKSAGIDPKHCNLFVSVIGLANAIGRVIAGILACKYNAFSLYQIAFWMAGVGTIAFNFSFNVYYQYFCCGVFGVFVAVFSCLRSVVIVDLFGLDKLTNGTGVLLMFQGLGSLVSTPLSSILKNIFGYSVSFYVSGTVLLLAGAVLVPVNSLHEKEKARQANVTINHPVNPQKK